MKTVQVLINKLVINPNNPRTVRDSNFMRLVKSMQEFPEMLQLRPIIVNKDMVIIGGNMRYKAAKEIGLKEVPVMIADLTEEQEKEFLIRDNVSSGDWDTTALLGEWNIAKVLEWGVDVDFGSNKEEEEPKKGKKAKTNTDKQQENFFIPDCIYNSNNIYDIPTLKMDNMPNSLDLPLKPYGAEARTNGGVGTYHFYVDDYRFEQIWNKPQNILQSGCTGIVEPNLSMYDTTPIAYGMYLIYKKRWLARYFQEQGLKIFVDLNVSDKFSEYNRLGVPDGYNAFFTRGYTGRLEYLKNELEVARQISGLKEPYVVVYGGSKEIQEYSAKHNLTFVKDYVNLKKQ